MMINSAVWDECVKKRDCRVRFVLFGKWEIKASKIKKNRKRNKKYRWE